MGVIVRKIRGLLSLIHLHYLAFQRQAFWYPFLTMTSSLSVYWHDACVLLLILTACIVCCCIIAGQCQTVVSTFAGANGRGYHQGSF
jgi:type IV secretory pathway TrbL component